MFTSHAKELTETIKDHTATAIQNMGQDTASTKQMMKDMDSAIINSGADSISTVLRVVMTIGTVISFCFLYYYRSVMVKYAAQAKYLDQ